MNRQMLLGIGVVAWSILAAPGASAGELPKLTVKGPPDGVRWAMGASPSVSGKVEPAFDTGICLELFHVLDDGGLIRQFRVGFSPREDGTFGAVPYPPPGGWLPGKTRMRVSLSNLSQVRVEYDVEVAGDPPAVLPNEPPIYEPKPSALVVTLPLTKVETYEIPPHSLFRVEGVFGVKPKFAGRFGPPLLYQILRVDPDGQRVSHDSLIGPTFREPDGSYWYQFQLRSPKKPGLYHISIGTIIPDDVVPGAFGASELPFSIQVVEPKPKKAEP